MFFGGCDNGAGLPIGIGVSTKRQSVKTKGQTAMPVLNLALRAWLIGLLTAGVLVLPGMTALEGLITEPFLATFPKRVLGFVVMIPLGVLMAMTFGLMLSAPLFLVGTLIAVVFRRQVASYPMAMTILAPICTVVIVASIDAATRDNEWARTHGFLAKFARIAMNGDMMLFAIPVAVAACYFCTRMKRESQRAS